MGSPSQEEVLPGENPVGGMTHWRKGGRGGVCPEEHTPGKRNTQKIERKHLTLRTRIKRLVRKTICFSKTTQMHDIVIGLFVNRYAFGRAV
jgi:IS1 transposase